MEEWKIKEWKIKWTLRFRDLLSLQGYEWRRESNLLFQWRIMEKKTESETETRAVYRGRE